MDSSLVLGPMLRYVDETTASVWVETRDTARVRVSTAGREWEAGTFSVHGHHYALVEVEGLEPGSSSPYTVAIDGQQVWPEEGSPFPTPIIRTLDPERPFRLAYGSCRTSEVNDLAAHKTHGVDSLLAFALNLVARDEAVRPDLIAFLGDQVYADIPSDEMLQLIQDDRGIDTKLDAELRNYEEYTQIYRFAWSGPAIRWLLSTLPSAMIFDDHDIRDDWNSSLLWKRKVATIPWWRDRIVSGLASYWVYQHLGNLSPSERAADEIWQAIKSHQGPGELELSSIVEAVVEEADRNPERYRWSFCRDFGDTRLIVLDSRAARVLQPGQRSMLDRKELQWLDERIQGDRRHLLVATSLPFLLPRGLHHIEDWNAVLADGRWGERLAAVGEWVRQAIDLEHWAAFPESFRAVATMATEVATGQRGAAPETVTFLSGDVHFSYIEEVDQPMQSRVLQAVCSPIRNPLRPALRWVAALMSTRVAGPLGGVLARFVPQPPFHWSTLKKPWFDNNLASLEVTEEGLKLRWDTGVVSGGNHAAPQLKEVTSITIAPRAAEATNAHSR
ncbi:alkaline phosphatase D family protein [Arthrobacter sp. EH-1B-1]|uniref:Alkaline phosphatase D family protein n=1 Tax=Arthrobacter vasquezii TaxID=2977629 RepID=A0ABT6CWA4_9MICC|nr:alkaline phosphatase D family protein [Arthrobacter vasquezii]MDF9278180.1 alkaline phosphatase D family protein [Arthrobacter vasquezii]